MHSPLDDNNERDGAHPATQPPGKEVRPVNDGSPEPDADSDVVDNSHSVDIESLPDDWDQYAFEEYEDWPYGTDE